MGQMLASLELGEMVSHVSPKPHTTCGSQIGDGNDKRLMFGECTIALQESRGEVCEAQLPTRLILKAYESNAQVGCKGGACVFASCGVRHNTQ